MNIGPTYLALAPVAVGTGISQGIHMSARDPYRIANLLLQQHGSDAKAYAMERVLDMHNAGDDRGEMMWMAVFDAVLELQSFHPPGHSVH